MPSFRSTSVFRAMRRLLTILRITCLVVLALAAVQLVIWNRNYDPRFYRFLRTVPGKALARIMQWPNLHEHREEDKPESDYTEEQLAWKRKLERQIRDSWPTHMLTFSDGTREFVRILSRSGSHLRIQEHFGGQGTLEKKVPLSTIQSIDSYDEPVPKVTWRDVQFQMEFPEFHLTYFGHYTVLTDAPYFQVESSIRELETLRDQFMDRMGSLIRFPKPRQSLQVLFFSNEDDFRAHQEDTAPELSSSAGYYSPMEDRMVVFNQRFSDRAEDIRRDVKDEVERLLQQARNQQERNRILNLKHHVEEQLRSRANLETMATLRHEGTHHLAYTYGVHSWIHTENGWLIEGLAVYFEPYTPGDIPLPHLSSLIEVAHDGRLPALSELLEVRRPREFETALPSLKAHEAYALSWSVVHFLMESGTRPAFMDYLRGLQDPEDIEPLMEGHRIERLAKTLKTTPEALEQNWRAHLRTL